ncbi:MAG: cell envelope biogenesis protein TolA [Alphaproteobacteria bacterium]|nr:cell envelope biogenesis protein TolA [Alphaproteobacteria bacterium]
MRTGVTVSGLLHVGAFVLMVVPLPFLMHDRAAEMAPLPPVVDIVTVDEMTNIAAAAPAPEPTPEPEAAKAPEPPPPAPEPARVVAAATPEPEEFLPEPEAMPKEEPPAAPVKMAAVPKAKPKPPKTPAKPAQPPKKQESYLDRVAALLDKMPREDQPAEQAEDAKKASASEAITLRTPVGKANALTLSEIDAIRAQMARCWSFPAGAAYAEELVVHVRVAFNPDGSLSGRPQILDTLKYQTGDTYFRAAADSAVRALLRCQPFTLPPEKYDSWQSVEFTFDPRYLLGR